MATIASGITVFFVKPGPVNIITNQLTKTNIPPNKITLKKLQ